MNLDAKKREATTDMLNVLLVTALQAEQISLPKSLFRTSTLITGVGKVPATYSLARVLNVMRPQLVLNVGSAGTVRYEPGDVLVCRDFVDRNLLGLEIESVPAHIESTVPDLFELPPSVVKGVEDREVCPVCATGDSFVTKEEEACGDVVDMEAFAMAYVCQQAGIDFLSVKCVTDVVGRNSIGLWEERLAEARHTLHEYFERYGHVLAANYGD
ncbi:MAG: nucleosidase [Bacteroidaceae bacterium]|nr:nucleosidase [Bacteroidaceae bacterium]